jgi:hypothetical protein
VINTTVLRRRISRFCAAHGGGKGQSGETLLAKSAGVAPNVVKKLREGADLREDTLRKVYEFLAARGY